MDSVKVGLITGGILLIVLILVIGLMYFYCLRRRRRRRAQALLEPVPIVVQVPDAYPPIELEGEAQFNPPTLQTCRYSHYVPVNLGTLRAPTESASVYSRQHSDKNRIVLPSGDEPVEQGLMSIHSSP